jgi:hypothetical protein
MAAPFKENRADLNPRSFPESWSVCYNSHSDGDRELMAQRLVDLFTLLDRVSLPSDKDDDAAS